MARRADRHVVRFRLEATATGTRLHYEQTGFTGLRAVMVSFLLGAGFKKMDARRLPAVLDRLARGEAVGDPVQGTARSAASAWRPPTPS